MKTTNPKDYIKLIEMFSFTLTKGLLDKEIVIDWADNIINQDSEPDIFIIELSLCGNKSLNDTISLINNYIEQEKSNLSGRVILGFIYRQFLSKKITLRNVIRTIYDLIWTTDLTEKEKNVIYILDNDFDLAQDGGYGSIEIIELDTLKFLEIYRDFQIDNFFDWDMLDETIESKIDLLLTTLFNKRIQIDNKKGKWWKVIPRISCGMQCTTWHLGVWIFGLLKYKYHSKIKIK